MAEHYPNAPLQEAVCEIRFGPTSTWDLALPGLIYERLREEFPSRGSGKSFQARLSPGPSGVQQEIVELEFLQFAAKDNSAFIRVAKNSLSVHHAKPYPGWSKFSPIIMQALRTYQEVAMPEKAEFVGLRFVNSIRIPGSQLVLERLFNFYPHVGDKMPQVLGAYIVGVEFPFEDALLRLQLTSQASDDSNVSVARMDLDYFSANAEALNLETIASWFDSAHERIRTVFEGAITDELRAIFREQSYASK